MASGHPRRRPSGTPSEREARAKPKNHTMWSIRGLRPRKWQAASGGVRWFRLSKCPAGMKPEKPIATSIAIPIPTRQHGPPLFPVGIGIGIAVAVAIGSFSLRPWLEGMHPARPVFAAFSAVCQKAACVTITIDFVVR